MLIKIFFSFIFMILSVIVALFSTKFVNSYKGTVTDSEEIIIKRYDRNSFYIMLLLLLAVISLVFSYSVFDYCSVNGWGYNRISLCIILSFIYFSFETSMIIDGKLRIIPNFIPLILLFIKVVLLFFDFLVYKTILTNLVSAFIGLFISFLILSIANKISRGGIGAGDIKLLSAVGFLGGFAIVAPITVCSFLVCCLIVVFLLFAKKITLKDSVPFAPFIYLGFVLVALLRIF